MKLGCWEEVIGRLNTVKDNGDGTVTIVLTVDTHTVEVTVLGEFEVFGGLVNHRIGLLRTDDPQRPYIIRLIEAGDLALHKERRL